MGVDELCLILRSPTNRGPSISPGVTKNSELNPFGNTSGPLSQDEPNIRRTDIWSARL